MLFITGADWSAHIFDKVPLLTSTAVDVINSAVLFFLALQMLGASTLQ